MDGSELLMLSKRLKATKIYFLATGHFGKSKKIEHGWAYGLANAPDKRGIALPEARLRRFAFYRQG